MPVRPALTRLGAPVAAVALVALGIAAPASAHVSVTPSVAEAGAFTVLTVSVPHGCDGTATTRVEVQIPEQVLAVTPTRNPLWQEKVVVDRLDEQRTGSIVYTAKEPLPDGVRDTFELSFQVPDAAGETLVFPTIQTCEQGRTAWIEVPEQGQDPHELESPAPSFEVLPAAEETTAPTQQTTVADSDVLGWAGLGAGALGLLVGGIALARTRRGA